MAGGYSGCRTTSAAWSNCQKLWISGVVQAAVTSVSRQVPPYRLTRLLLLSLQRSRGGRERQQDPRRGLHATSCPRVPPARGRSVPLHLRAMPGDRGVGPGRVAGPGCMRCLPGPATIPPSNASSNNPGPLMAHGTGVPARPRARGRAPGTVASPCARCTVAPTNRVRPVYPVRPSRTAARGSPRDRRRRTPARCRTA